MFIEIIGRELLPDFDDTETLGFFEDVEYIRLLINVNNIACIMEEDNTIIYMIDGLILETDVEFDELKSKIDKATFLSNTHIN